MIYQVTVYRDDSVSSVVYNNVKHCFWTCRGTVLTIAIYSEDGKTHHYVNWLREQVCWYKVVKVPEVDFEVK